MLTLPITLKWFTMIVSGEKKEEYREVKEYWTKRFQSIGLVDERGNPTMKTEHIILRNGYGKKAMTAKVRVTIKKSTGKVEWGAEPGKTYWVLKIWEVESNAKIKPVVTGRTSIWS